MGGADDWWLTCTKCGHRWPAVKSGVVRVGARSKGKRLLVRCVACGQRTFARCECLPPPQEAAPTAPPPS